MTEQWTARKNLKTKEPGCHFRGTVGIHTSSSICLLMRALAARTSATSCRKRSAWRRQLEASSNCNRGGEGTLGTSGRFALCWKADQETTGYLLWEKKPVLFWLKHDVSSISSNPLITCSVMGLYFGASKGGSVIGSLSMIPFHTVTQARGAVVCSSAFLCNGGNAVNKKPTFTGVCFIFIDHFCASLETTPGCCLRDSW